MGVIAAVCGGRAARTKVLAPFWAYCGFYLRYAMLIFLKRHGYAVRLLGGGAGVFAPSLGLPVVRVVRKKRGVRISPFFSALHGRTPCKVGVKAIEFWRRKKGGVDWENCGMERSGMEQFCPLVRFPAEKKLEIAPLRLFVSDRGRYCPFGQSAKER